jgi:hypothetical protein
MHLETHVYAQQDFMIAMQIWLMVVRWHHLVEVAVEVTQAQKTKQDVLQQDVYGALGAHLQQDVILLGQLVN